MHKSGFVDFKLYRSKETLLGERKCNTLDNTLDYLRNLFLNNETD